MFTRPLLALALGVALTLTACDSVQESSGDLTTAELSEVTQIIADGLAEDTGGLFASAANATSIVSEDGLVATPLTLRGYVDGRNPACGSGGTVNYDAETGTHSVFYGCVVDLPTAGRNYQATLDYQFRDATGGFIENPQLNQDAIATVDFSGEASGSTFFVRRTTEIASTFEQSAEWDLVGLDGDVASFTVRQQRSGTNTYSSASNANARVYSLEISGDDIQMVSRSNGEGGAAVGQLEVSLSVELMRRGERVTRDVEGTVELTESGTAMLRLFGIPDFYQLSLGDGTVIG